MEIVKLTLSDWKKFKKIRLEALKLYQSLGFKTIGIMHKEMKVNGKYYDEYLMEKIF